MGKNLVTGGGGGGVMQLSNDTQKIPPASPTA